MNFDFIEASKSLGKDKPCLGYLEYEATYKSGWEKFFYQGCKSFEIWINLDFDLIKIKGSIPYLMEGQNFRNRSDILSQGINHLSEILQVDFFQSEVKAFEYGTILDIPFTVKELLNSHIKIQGMKVSSFDYGKYFEDNVLKIKLYDAGKNIKEKVSMQERERLSLSYGYSAIQNYLKIENHYKRPSIYFKKRIIQVSDLIKPDFQNTCKENLLTKYRSIMKSNSINISSKKQLTSSTIPLLVLKEYESLLPMRVEDLIKQKIKAIPFHLLSKEDKKARKRQIMINMKKLSLNAKCIYDISDLLEAKISFINN